MLNEDKVVPLNKANADTALNSPLARLPVVLLQVRDKAAQQIKDALQELFDNADDTLFEMADRAHNNTEQNSFFEAMRDLRLKRKSIERAFLDKFYEAFLRIGQYQIDTGIQERQFAQAMFQRVEIENSFGKSFLGRKECDFSAGTI